MDLHSDIYKQTNEDEQARPVKRQKSPDSSLQSKIMQTLGNDDTRNNLNSLRISDPSFQMSRHEVGGNTSYEDTIVRESRDVFVAPLPLTNRSQRSNANVRREFNGPV